MKRKRFSMEQIVAVLKQAEIGVPVAELIRQVGITRVHLEEDTGKTTHAGATGRIAGAEYALEDYNRAGVPLVEIVSARKRRPSANWSATKFQAPHLIGCGGPETVAAMQRSATPPPWLVP